MTENHAADREVATRIEEIFAEARVEGFLHAKEIGRDRELGVQPDGLVVLASVFKIVVAIAYARAIDSGRLDGAEQATVTAAYRFGGIGTGGCAGDVTMSWRDLAEFMITMSDNAATDVLFDRLGQAAIDEVIRDLGLRHTTIRGCCRDLLAIVQAELDTVEVVEPTAGRGNAWPGVTDEQIRGLSIRNPALTPHASTAREVSRLLEAVWRDEVASPEACAMVRGVLSRQVWPHRIGAGFDSSVMIAGKTGTLDGLRNEAAVVSYGDGRDFVVSIFTRSPHVGSRNAAQDAAIGEVARLAVDHLR